jgi:metal-responsive CopG/Arc/MetJ family transcriptional regulator
MRTIQMTLDDGLVEEVDRVVKELGAARSSFSLATPRSSFSARSRSRRSPRRSATSPPRSF